VSPVRFLLTDEVVRRRRRSWNSSGSGRHEVFGFMGSNVPSSKYLGDPFPRADVRNGGLALGQTMSCCWTCWCVRAGAEASQHGAIKPSGDAFCRRADFRRWRRRRGRFGGAGVSKRMVVVHCRFQLGRLQRAAVMGEDRGSRFPVTRCVWGNAVLKRPYVSLSRLTSWLPCQPGKAGRTGLSAWKG